MNLFHISKNTMHVNKTIFLLVGCLATILFFCSPLLAELAIMPLGDSITYGRYNGEPEDELIVGYRQSLWLSLISAGYDVSFVGSLETGQSANPDFDTDHEGHPGWNAGSTGTISSIDDHVVDFLTNNPADIILLHIGTNDLSRSEGAESTVQDVQVILDNIDSVDENIIVLLAKIIDWQNLNPEVTQFNNLLETMANERIINGDKLYIVDQHGALNYPADMSDTLHPLPVGYHKMADTWFAALEDILHIVSPAVDGPGTLNPATPQTVVDTDPISFIVTPDVGNYLTSISGCNGTLSGNTYTTAAIHEDCTITATFGDHYTITATSDNYGSINPSGAIAVNHESSQDFTINPFTGYSISDVTVDGASIGPVNSYTFTDVTRNHTIYANFSINSYIVTPVAGDHGNIDPLTPQSVEYEKTATFMISPDSGYHIEFVEGCNGSRQGNIYTTGPITEGCTVTAGFAINSYEVTPSVTEHGSFDPSIPQNVDYGKTTSFTLIPFSGYHIASVTGCGGSLSGNIYTTGSIASACTVTAEFDSNNSRYTVTSSSGEHGIITPSLPLSIKYGETTSFTVIPDSGYHIASVIGCGGRLSGDIYTTGPITADCIIRGTFIDNNQSKILVPVLLLLLNPE